MRSSRFMLWGHPAGNLPSRQPRLQMCPGGRQHLPSGWRQLHMRNGWVHATASARAGFDPHGAMKRVVPAVTCPLGCRPCSLPPAGYSHCISLGSCRAFPAPDSLFMYSTCCSDAQWVNECRSIEAMAVACQSGRCKPVIGRPMAAGAAGLSLCSGQCVLPTGEPKFPNCCRR